MKLNVILTGATGMVGEGVLHESLNHRDVKSVLVINRKKCNVEHPKIKEIIIDNFYDLSSIENQLLGYNACFFCLGTTSIGKSEELYSKITFELTRTFADTLVKLNPEMTFCYVSGSGTDTSEKGKLMWARVKGKTESYLLSLFPKAYMFRPGLIIPTKGLKNTLRPYKILSPLIPIIKLIIPNFICSLKEIGVAMINSSTKGFNKNILEVKDIKILAQK